jgi:tripartite-type tricarboxylate transporter receptor subunit TctC
MKKLLLILVATAATLFSAALYADDYPSRPITIVNVFGPGSGSDTICRIIADKLSPVLGQPVLVEDRPGADGALAALYVHHQPADGYTLLMGTNSPLSADPFIHRGLGYDPIKDFVPIAAKIIRELNEIKMDAKHDRAHAAAVSAVMGKAKVLGIVDKPQDNPQDWNSAQSMQDIGRKLLQSVGYAAPSDADIALAIEANDQFIAELERIRAEAEGTIIDQ